MSTDPDCRRAAARRALAEAVWIRDAVRKLGDAYLKNGPDPDLVEPLMSTLDAVVRRRVGEARTAGIGTTALVGIVGVGRSRIIRILRQELG